MMRIIATFFYTGLLRPTPGTWGSLAAVIAALPLYALGGAWAVLVAAILAFLIGIPATKSEVKASGSEDPSHVVIDEVAGQWIALLPVSFGAAATKLPLTSLWPGILTAFLLFRLFDIWKPGPIGWVDRRGDAPGVMLDDIIAGIFAAIGAVALAAVSHALMTAG